MDTSFAFVTDIPVYVGRGDESGSTFAFMLIIFVSDTDRSVVITIGSRSH